MTCVKCAYRRAFCRSAGVGLWSSFRTCYDCWQRRRAVRQLAGNAALVLAGSALVLLGMFWLVQFGLEVGR